MFSVPVFANHSVLHPCMWSDVLLKGPRLRDGKAANAVDAVRANFLGFERIFSKLFAFFVQLLAFLLTFERF